MGKVAMISLAGFAAIVGVAKYVSGSAVIQIASVALVAIVLLIIVRWILEYADKHPQSATLEGAEIILWQQQQIMLAAKGINAPTDAPAVASPLGNHQIADDTKEGD